MVDFTEKWLPTYIKRDGIVLFCGINPGRVSATAGYHYANPGNLFWRGLYEGGLTPYQLRPEETSALLEFGYGITDLVYRPTRSANELTEQDFAEGAGQFRRVSSVSTALRPSGMQPDGKKDPSPWDFSPI